MKLLNTFFFVIFKQKKERNDNNGCLDIFFFISFLELKISPTGSFRHSRTRIKYLQQQCRNNNNLIAFRNLKQSMRIISGILPILIIYE